MNPEKNEIALTEQQIADLQSEDDYLRGVTALGIVNDSLEKAGITIPADYIFKKRDRAMTERAIHSTFELLGGVPGMILWAKQNPTPFYTAYMKLAPAETGGAFSGANFIIQSSVPESPLDRTMIDEQGRVIDAEISEDDFGVDDEDDF